MSNLWIYYTGWWLDLWVAYITHDLCLFPAKDRVAMDVSNFASNLVDFTFGVHVGYT